MLDNYALTENTQISKSVNLNKMDRFEERNSGNTFKWQSFPSAVSSDSHKYMFVKLLDT